MQDHKNFRVLVVDNGSSDDSVARLEKIAAKHPKKLSLINNGRNLGFAGGVNTGIQHAITQNFDMVALFNNDATADKKWLSSLAASMKDGVGSVTGLLLHADGETIDSSGDFFSTWGMPGPRGRGTKAKTASSSGPVFGGTGGATLYNTALFKDIGLFDETFFLYYEDVDIAFRAQLAGYKAYYTNKAVAYHKQGASSGKVRGLTVYHTFKNVPLLFWKNVPTKLIIPIGVRLFLLYTLIFGNAVKNGNGWYALKGWVMSLWYFWTSALWKRFSIQHKKRVSAEYIWSVLLHDLPADQTGMRKFRSKFTGKK
jgi:GT2 family glycosyltransferase